ncbi:RNA polymerase sigma-70 factor [Sphingobacterium sp. SRCM116780]|uniref:RNA polymerase sigma-70 factor n=1 Tax=Sphingobacterium sp. SRCM116780 TaxID=2907623 RepID=UPI001F2740F6|nr:RNA polymerase sigma-70 factor [Sphingobacterium sp. SRCM116780]UIR55678.1 RNA polymerase sigma-70 factor [Sphingobacterium sp. SRCM116780]
MNVHDNLSDNELIDLLKANQEQALSALYFRYWDKLLVVAGNHIHDYDIAEESVQDVFVSLWKRRHSLDLKYSLANYLAVAIKYRVISQQDKQYRYLKNIESSSNENNYHLSPAADELILEKEILQKIEASIDKLPEKCRIIFRMNREEGKTYKQIANELDISEKTVETHISKAIKHLRNDLTCIPPAVILWLIGSRF